MLGAKYFQIENMFFSQMGHAYSYVNAIPMWIGIQQTLRSEQTAIRLVFIKVDATLSATVLVFMCNHVDVPLRRHIAIYSIAYMISPFGGHVRKRIMRSAVHKTFHIWNNWNDFTFTFINRANYCDKLWLRSAASGNIHLENKPSEIVFKITNSW